MPEHKGGDKNVEVPAPKQKLGDSFEELVLAQVLRASAMEAGHGRATADKIAKRELYNERWYNHPVAIGDTEECPGWMAFKERKIQNEKYKQEKKEAKNWKLNLKKQAEKNEEEKRKKKAEKKAETIARIELQKMQKKEKREKRAEMIAQQELQKEEDRKSMIAQHELYQARFEQLQILMDAVPFKTSPWDMSDTHHFSVKQMRTLRSFVDDYRRKSLALRSMRTCYKRATQIATRCLEKSSDADTDFPDPNFIKADDLKNFPSFDINDFASEFESIVRSESRGKHKRMKEVLDRIDKAFAMKVLSTDVITGLPTMHKWLTMGGDLSPYYNSLLGHISSGFPGALVGEQHWIVKRWHWSI